MSYTNIDKICDDLMQTANDFYTLQQERMRKEAKFLTIKVLTITNYKICVMQFSIANTMRYIAIMCDQQVGRLCYYRSMK